MGLLLSVLVACVGVAELLAFYQNVRRSLLIRNNVNFNHRVDCLATKYRQDFNNAKIQLEDDIENIELEFADSLKPTKTKFLLTEQEPSCSSRSRSVSPRRFLVTNQPSLDQDLQDLPVFQVEERNPNDESLQRHFLIKNGTKTPLRDVSPLPLPRQFVVAKDLDKLAIESEQEKLAIFLKNANEDDGDVFRRSPSPYPPPILPAPRNSISEPPIISVQEVDEDFCEYSNSPSPEERMEVILESKHDSSEFWTPNRILVDRSMSRSPVCRRKKHTRHKSVSPPRLLGQSEDTISSSLDKMKSKSDSSFGQYLDCLDGLKNKKVSSSFKKSKRKEPRDDFLSSSSNHNNNHNNSDLQVAKTLTEAANVLKLAEDCQPSSSKMRSSGSPEPFWVNRY